MCYLVVAGLGLVGLASKRWVPVVILAMAVVGAMLLPPITYGGALTQQPMDAATSIMFLAARTAIMFSAGALIYHFRGAIPARWSLVGLSVFVVLAASLLPDYRVVAALPLAYALIVSGALVRNKRFRLRTDLSYGLYIYAFPIQQLLVISGLVFLNPPVFAVISTAATLPLAALSWFLVEKRALALKRRFRSRSTPSVVEPAEQRQPG
jgi:peptidoglycan/LPS O-acetylase OafA/YrhL